MIVSVTNPILETSYWRRAALYLFLYERPYAEVKKNPGKLCNWITQCEVYEDTALAMPENSWDFLLPEEIGHDIEPL